MYRVGWMSLYKFLGLYICVWLGCQFAHGAYRCIITKNKTLHETFLNRARCTFLKTDFLEFKKTEKLWWELRNRTVMLSIKVWIFQNIHYQHLHPCLVEQSLLNPVIKLLLTLSHIRAWVRILNHGKRKGKVDYSSLQNRHSLGPMFINFGFLSRPLKYIKASFYPIFQALLLSLAYFYSRG